jgi:hypothetical protein
MRALCTATTAVALAAFVVACGGGATKTVTVTTAGGGTPTSRLALTVQTGTNTGTAPQPTTGPSTTPLPTRSTGAATPPPTAIVHLTTFRSPSGNIGCALFEGSARCDIMHRDWSPPPKPATCQFDFGQGLDVYGGSRGQLVCAGDTALDPSAPVLHYGTASVVGPDECVSAATGMTCTDTRTGHGFWIAIQGYRTF